jgi:hypothetical protein
MFRFTFGEKYRNCRQPGVVTDCVGEEEDLWEEEQVLRLVCGHGDHIWEEDGFHVDEGDFVRLVKRCTLRFDLFDRRSVDGRIGSLSPRHRKDDSC